MRGRSDVVRIGGMASAVVTVGGMIATPLVAQRGPARRLLSSVVVVGLAATTGAAAARRWGARRAGVAAAVTTVATALVERIGTDTGIPFGRYRYTQALRPTVGGVPAIVPLAWFAMALPARETVHAALGGHSSRLTRAIAGSAALTAWDLFLDPQMVGEGYWRWRRTGRYRGIPATNFLGWFVTGIAVVALLDAILPPARRAVDADGALIGEYAYMGVMETLGFAAFFRDPLVATVGGAAMLPPAIVAVLRKRHG